MARQRLTWNRRKHASPPPQIPAIGRTEDPDHPAYLPDPEADQYESGDTSSWAEDPYPGPYPTPGSTPPAMPGNLVTEDIDHPAAIVRQAAFERQASFRREAQERATLCVHIASSLMPGASEAKIERRALDLMDYDTSALRKMLASLSRTAEDEEEEDEEEVDVEEDDDDDEDDDEEDMTAGKKKKAALDRRLARIERALYKLAKKAEEDEEVEVEEEEEEETASKKKASRRRKSAALQRKAADIKARKSGLMRLAKEMKTRKGRKYAMDFFGMDEDEIVSCMRAERDALVAEEEEMAMYDDMDYMDVDMDMDDDGVYQNSPDTYDYDMGEPDLYAMDEDEFVEDDMGMYAQDEDDGELMAMLTDMARKHANDAEEAVDPRNSGAMSGDGGNVNPEAAPETPQVMQSLKQAGDPMGVFDEDTKVAADDDLAILFGDYKFAADEEEEVEEEEVEETASKKKATLRPQRKAASARGPRSLGSIQGATPKKASDEIANLEKLWGMSPNLDDYNV